MLCRVISIRHNTFGQSTCAFGPLALLAFGPLGLWAFVLNCLECPEWAGMARNSLGTNCPMFANCSGFGDVREVRSSEFLSPA